MWTSRVYYQLNEDLTVQATPGCTLDSTEHAETLDGAQTAVACLLLVRITIFKQSYMLDVYKLNYRQLTYTIDNYWWLQTMPAVDALIDTESQVEAPLNANALADTPLPWYILIIIYTDIEAMNDGQRNMSLVVGVQRIPK